MDVQNRISQLPSRFNQRQVSWHAWRQFGMMPYKKTAIPLEFKKQFNSQFQSSRFKQSKPNQLGPYKKQLNPFIPLGSRKSLNQFHFPRIQKTV
jgi:hypothetical protein